MNKYAHFQEPEETFDFHDRGILDGAAVKRLTEAFVRGARANGRRRVRLITGKGVHSKAEPLVGPQVRRTLEELRREGVVAGFGDAKLGAGGAGAVDVVLSPD